MPENRHFLPEGLRPPSTFTLSALKDAQLSGQLLEATVSRCDAAHTLTVPLGTIRGVIPREEAVAPWISGAERDIALLSRVGKKAVFQVKSLSCDEKGAPVALLSRKTAQEAAMDYFLKTLQPGMLLVCRITHLASFGAFADIGCGIIAMLPIELISVSRLSHSRERFVQGQKILAVVKDFDRQTRRITLSHRELLGTWMENASRFAPGETVQGIVRSVKDYGAFVELTPNLSGLADLREGLEPGDRVSVFIKSLRPERMKIKLQIIERLPPLPQPPPIQYQITDGPLERWIYSPPGCEKASIETVFTASAP